MITLNEANNSAKREQIYKKARLILKERKEWEFHKTECLKAGICPNCGEVLNSSGYCFYNVLCKCGYKYSTSSGEEQGRTI